MLKSANAFSFVLTDVEDEETIEQFREILEEAGETSPLGQML